MQPRGSSVYFLRSMYASAMGKTVLTVVTIFNTGYASAQKYICIVSMKCIGAHRSMLLLLLIHIVN